MINIAVLAGGSSTRFTLNKLLYSIKGKPLIQYILDKVRRCRCITKTVLIVTPLTSQMFFDLGLDVVTDFLGIGPLGGVYTALKMLSEVMVIGGDMPFVNCEFVETMINLCEDYEYACLPMWRETGFMEPLASIYNKNFLSILEQAITINEYSVQRIIKRFNVKVKTIDIEKYLKNFADVFININKFEDLDKILEKVS